MIFGTAPVETGGFWPVNKRTSTFLLFIALLDVYLSSSLDVGICRSVPKSYTFAVTEAGKGSVLYADTKFVKSLLK